MLPAWNGPLQFLEDISTVFSIQKEALLVGKLTMT